MRIAHIIMSAILSYTLHLKYNLTTYEALSVFLSSAYILYFMDNLGKKIQIIEIIGVGACLLWLVMPIFAYHYFNEGNYLAKLWLIYMYVPSDTYYEVVFWGTVAMLAGLHFPFKKLKILTAREYTERLKLNDQNYGKISKILLLIGVLSLVLMPIVPAALGQVFEISGNFIFVAAFYAYYSHGLNKFWLMAVVIAMIISISIYGGMFGKLVFISILATMIVLVVRERKISMFRKITISIVGIFLIIILQSVKHEYRKNTWGGYAGYTGYSGSKTALFFDLIGEKLKDPFAVFEDEGQLFALLARFNQGWLVSKVINYIPNHQPYVGSEPLTAAIVGGFVPRFLWQDKPVSGGRENMMRYAGVKLTKTSMNVAPVGEAYGSFGLPGAWIFMFFFGLFFRWSFLKILVVAKQYPTLILWVPSIYVMVVRVESDVLTGFNAFTKSVLMVWIMYKVFLLLFKIRL